MKTSDDENLDQVLKDSMTAREERERNLGSDSDQLFLLSLLGDFKNKPKQRRLSRRMELIEVIKTAQMLFIETHTEFGMFRQGYAEP